MGGQAYLTRLAFFDDHGHPQNTVSQELSRQSRRAQNDVLATVGVLVGPDQRYQAIANPPITASDKAKFEVLVDQTENETSSGGLAKAFIILTSSWFHDRATFLRKRMQVFPFYSGLPFLEILKTEWTFSRPLALVFRDDVAIAVALTRQQDSSNVSGLDFTIGDGTYELEKDVRTVRELVERDWALARNSLRALPTWCRSLFTARTLTPNGPLPQIEQQIENDHPYLTYRSSDSAPGQQSPARPDGLPASHEQRRPSLSYHGSAARGVREGINWVQPASWEIITGQGSSAGVEVVYDLSRVHRKLHDPSRATHHVTHLTSCMADTLAFYLSIVVTHIVWLPFETLLLRSIVRAYLDTGRGASSSTSWLRNEIYPKGSWFGAGLREGGALDYARRIALATGLEVALGLGTWQLGAGLTWWLGTSRYKWGGL
ncbi:MAG: hypothetical protein Q9208_003959 [Pyrenodesmia sp. 3 TL-2023]